MTSDAPRTEEDPHRRESMIAALERLQAKTARERVEPSRDAQAAPPDWQPPRPGGE
jgi:hypothetical protein